MKQLSPLELDMLTAIATRYPLPLHEVRGAYKLTNSIDQTIKVIEYAQKRAICIYDAVQSCQAHNEPLLNDKRYTIEEFCNTMLKSLRKDEDAFRKACLPLIKYICENHHPHVKVIVTPIGAELVEGLKSTGEIMDYVKD